MHMKLKHAGTFFDTVYCKQENCIRSFSDIYTFKKHLNIKHSTVMKSLVKIDSLGNDENSEKNLTAIDKPCKPSSSITAADSYRPSVAEFKSTLTKSASAFIAKLYCNPHISKTAIQDIILNVKEFFLSDFLNILKEIHMTDTNNSYKNDFNEMIEALSDPFQNIETIYNREQYLEKIGCLIRPSGYLIGTEECPKQINNTMTVKMTKVEGQIIPLRIIFKTFLELLNVFNTITNYINKCSKEKYVTSFLNADLWLKTKDKFPGKFVIPLMFFFDDFEINNPIGSRKSINKISAIYCKMLAIPPQYSSLIDNIFLVALHKSRHLNSFGSDKILAPVINELKYLENVGISIKIENRIQQVYFTLSLFAGDNLGIHTLFGFHESFRSNYYCHLCRADKKILSTATVEDKQYLRTKLNFQEDVQNLTHGIKNDTLIHSLPNFHVTENVYCDVMHDVLEGICRYVIIKILNIFINIDKLFTLKTVNYRIRFFNYKNKSSRYIPSLTSDALKNSIFICSASEMKLLLENLGLMIGDLIPENNKAWDLYLTLREIHCILVKTCITKDKIKLLRSSIAKHHRLYQDIFKEPLKPKFHFLVHYPTIIEKIGPIYAVSCLRFEAKHKEFKEYARVARTRKNICYTLAIRHQLKFAYRFQAQKGFHDRITFGQKMIKTVHQLSDYDLFKSFVTESDLDEYKHVLSSANINGIEYKTDMLLIIGEENDLLQFGKLKYILSNDKRNIAFLLLNMRTKCFIRHIHGLSIDYTSEWSIVTYHKLFHYQTSHMCTLADGTTCVSC